MKRLISVIIFLSFCIMSLHAGQMSIHLQDGSTESFDISELNYIMFVEQGDTGTVTDIDGNVYQTIVIGDQEWMMENLKVTHYRNGDQIQYITDNSEWVATEEGAYCMYDNDPVNANTYGALYNSYAVHDNRGLAPEGWHVPTDDEWQELVDYLGGNDVAGGKMKERGTAHWKSPNTDATNESGFTALPGGLRTEIFFSIGSAAAFWSSSFSLWSLSYDNSDVVSFHIEQWCGHSIRCIRD